MEKENNIKSHSFTFGRFSPRRKGVRQIKSENDLKSIPKWEEVKCPNSLFDFIMQDRHYKIPYQYPAGTKLRYLEYIHNFDFQLFELFDDGKYIYLVRWGGPPPLEKYTLYGKEYYPFMVLWDAFVNHYRVKRRKRVLLHRQEHPMKWFLESSDHAYLADDNIKQILKNILPQQKKSRGFRIYDIRRRRLFRTDKFRFPKNGT